MAQSGMYVAASKCQLSLYQKIFTRMGNDDNLYAINSDGSLRFSVLTGDNVNTSPSFANINNNIYVIFGSKDDKMYAVDIIGNALSNWPMVLDGNIEGGIVFSDMNGDGSLEITAISDVGTMYVFHLNGDKYHHFPIDNGFPFTGPPLIIDIDSDEDVEIISGSLNNIIVIDIKEIGNSTGFWNVFRGNKKRTGYYLDNGGSECSVELGDVNGDTIINILDLVQMANYIIELSTPTYECAADFNEDGVVNILDLVQTANYILEN